MMSLLWATWMSDMTGTVVTGPVPLTPHSHLSGWTSPLCVGLFPKSPAMLWQDTQKELDDVFTVTKAGHPVGWTLPLWVGLTSDEESAVGKPATRMSDMTGTAKAESVVPVPHPPSGWILFCTCVFTRVKNPYEILLLPPPPRFTALGTVFACVPGPSL